MKKRATHWVWLDDPSASSRRSRRAACGEWVDPADVVNQREQVTCETCTDRINTFENLQIGDEEHAP